MGAAQHLRPRQSNSDLRNDDDGDWDNESWWWSDTGYAVRYALVCVIFAAIMLYFVGGYVHAQSRVKKGQPPLAYHRWMVRNRVRYQQQPQYQQHYQYGQDPYQEGYVMHGYAPPPNPPPAYHGDAPPAYMPPEGASKALADQNYHPHPAPRPVNEGESSSAAATASVPPRQ